MLAYKRHDSRHDRRDDRRHDPALALRATAAPLQPLLLAVLLALGVLAVSVADVSAQPATLVRPDALPRPLPPVGGGQAPSGPVADSAVPAAPPALLVFVSFSLPDATLERLIVQAERCGAVLLLRGLEQQSLLQTVQHAQRLIGQHRVAWQIDPQAFKRFQVAQAPTFVLTREAAAAPCQNNSCAVADDYLGVAGDVSMDYALEVLGASAPAYQPIARAFRQRLEGKP